MTQEPTKTPMQAIHTPMPEVWPPGPNVKVACHRHRHAFDPRKYRGCAICYQQARERAAQKKAAEQAHATTPTATRAPAASTQSLATTPAASAAQPASAAPEIEPLFKDRPTFAESPFKPDSIQEQTASADLPTVPNVASGTAVADTASSATSTFASAASPVPPRTPKSKDSAYTLVEQAPVQQGLWGAAILILFSGLGIFMIHKAAYDNTLGVFDEEVTEAFGEAIREREWTEEELAKLPPEVRQLIEAQAAETNNFDGNFDGDFESQDFESQDFENDDQDWDGE